MKKRTLFFFVTILALILTYAGFAEGAGETAMDYRTEEIWCQNGTDSIYGIAYIPDTNAKVPLVIFSHELGNNHESGIRYAERLAQNGLTIQMSMYGGFEQVGSIGQRLPSHDVQTNTSSGDIVLYSSSQLVVFYGSNSWAYTRLGRITDQSAEEMRELLSRGDVTITISVE